jgi:hypothetical protein
MSDPSRLVATRTVFVVFAPFGDDAMLTFHPDSTTRDLLQHSLVRNLLQVARGGVHVLALIDRLDFPTALVRIPGGAADQIAVTPCGKLDMSEPQTLTWLLQTAHTWQPDADVVLSIEGHGAGFLPDLDEGVISEALNNSTDIEWRISSEGSRPLPKTGGVLPKTGGVLPKTGGVLPQAVGVLPGMPMATHALARALSEAVSSGVPKLAVIHFCNCFNLSIEILHSIMPYARFAGGYPNYNYFTAGEAYPGVFAVLSPAGATAHELAHAFVKTNGDLLKSRTGHPSAGGMLKLARMKEIIEDLDDFADALLHALRSTRGKARRAVVEWIRRSIADAQQYDTSGDFTLEVRDSNGVRISDQFTDIRGFAMWMINNAAAFHPTSKRFPHIIETAQALAFSAVDMIVYAESGRPWMAPRANFEFDHMRMAMNILLPDPMLEGIWDWRTPFYIDVNPDPAQPRVQRGIIDFLQVTDWVDFILEYHKGVKFKRFLPRPKPIFPVYNPTYVPEDLPPGSPGQVGQTGA